VAKLTALFCSLMAAAYAALQIQPSAIMGLLLTSGPAFVVILWLQKDARRTGVGAVQDFGYFLWLAASRHIAAGRRPRTTAGRRLSLAAFTVMRSVSLEKPGTQIAQYVR
jgi:hypothetical protein